MSLQKDINNCLVNVDKICRVCLLLSDVSPLSECEHYDTFLILQRFWVKKAKLAKQLIPSNICQKCSDELQIVDTFITKLETSTERLSKLHDNVYEQVNDSDSVTSSKSKQNQGDRETNEVEYVETAIEEIIIIEGSNTEEEYKNDMTENIEESKELNHATCKLLKSQHFKNWQCNMQVHNRISRYKKKYQENLSTEFEKSITPRSLATLTLSGNFKCNLCGIKLKGKNSLNEHLSSHTEYNCLCELCGRIYKDDILLEQHRIFVHGEQEEITLKSSKENKTRSGHYVCKCCKKIFTIKSNLTRHMSIVHEKSKRFNCNICGEKFTVKNSLKYHLYIHSNKKPFECNICNKSFRQPNALIRHKRTKHNKEKNFECYICLKKLKSSITLEKHMSKHIISI